MGVLRAWQARNCVPKPFHYFELVLLTPLRQPKLGPLRLSPVARVEHEEIVRILRRPSSCASASSEAQGDRDLAADAGPRGPPALRPPGSGELQLQRQALAALHHPVLDLDAIQAQKRKRWAAAGAVGSDAGQGEQAGGAGHGEEYEVDDILNKQVAKGSGSAKSRTEYLVSWKGFPWDDATSMANLEGSAELISAYERTVNAS